MTDKIDEYISLISEFIKGDIDATEFRNRYLNKFKNEKENFPEEAFDVLDQLFGDTDSFTEDKDLLTLMPDFYVTADQLKHYAVKAIARLTKTT